MDTETLTPNIQTNTYLNIGQGDYTKDKYKEKDLSKEESIRQINEINTKHGIPLLTLD